MNYARRIIETAIAGGGLLIALFMPVATEAATGTCVTTTTTYRVTDTAKGTTSTSFVNIPQSGVVFVQGGSAPGCVIVTFTAVITTASTWMYVKATLDGNDPIDPGSGVWRVTSQESRTAVFVFPSVAPASHTMVLKFRSLNGGNVTVYNRTTTVSYRK